MNFPSYQDFVLPYGRTTDKDFAANAAGAYGGLFGALAQAASSQAAAEAQAAATRDSARYGGLANALGGYTSFLGNNSASAANAYAGLGAGLGALSQSRVNNAASRNNSYTGLATGLGGAFSNMFGAYSGALQGLGTAQSNEAAGLANAYSAMQGQLAQGIANTYGGYSSGIGNIAQARANEIGNLYNSNAMAEAARQAAIGNIGSSALGAFGSAAGSAMGAFGQAESAYQNARGNTAAANQNAVSGIGAANQGALAGVGAARANAYGQLGTANQGAISNIAASRNNALAGLGNAYSDAGQGLGAAALVGDLDIDFRDYGFGGPGSSGGFSASGPNGGIAEGSYGGSGGFGNGGMSFTATRRQNNSGLEGVTDKTFSGLDGLSSRLDNQPGYGELSNSLASSQQAIAADPAYSEIASGMQSALSGLAPGLNSLAAGPNYSFLSNSLGTTLSGLSGLASDSYRAAGDGMNQFYASRPEPTDYSSYLAQLGSSYGAAMGQMADLGQDEEVFRRSDYSQYIPPIQGALGVSMNNINSLANRGFSSVDSNTYSDSDLLSGLFGGYEGSLNAMENSAQQAGEAYRNTTGMLGNSRGSDEGRPNIAAQMLQSVGSKPKIVSPLKQVAKREYEALVSGGTSKFNPASPDYDQRAAQQLARLSNIIRNNNVPAWSA